MAAPLSSDNHPEDYTQQLMGSGLPSLMLYAARHSGSPNFKEISLKDCSFSLDRDPGAMAVVLRLRAYAPRVAPEPTLGQLEFTVRVPLLPTDGPGLIGDQSLSASQLSRLQQLSDLRFPTPAPRQPLRELHVEEATPTDLPHMTGQLGKFALIGTILNDSGERFFVDNFFFVGTQKLAVSAVDIYGDDGGFRVPRSPADIAGYLVSSSFIRSPTLLSGWHRKMAQTLFEKILGHLDDFGPDFTAQELSRIIDHVAEDPNHFIGDAAALEVLRGRFDATPIEIPLERLEKRFRKPGLFDFRGIASDSSAQGALHREGHYVDLRVWRASLTHSTKRSRPSLSERDAVLLRAVDTSHSRVLLPPSTPDRTTGYIIQIGPDRGGAYLPTTDRAYATDVFDEVIKTYRRKGLRAALDKAWEFESNF